MNWMDCCVHCGCDEGDRIGHDDTCRYGCNDEPEAMKKMEKGPISKMAQLAEHMEIDHERELPGLWSFKDLWILHHKIHILRDDLDHEH